MTAIIEDGCILDVNPATEVLIQKVPITQDVQKLVSAARQSQKPWARKPVAERVDLLAKACDAATAIEELAQMMSDEMGKPLEHAIGECCMIEDLKGSLGVFEAALKDEVTVKDGFQNRVIRDPVGVVAVMSTWNFPVVTALSLLLPALATGNTVVFKPPEACPLTGKLIYEAFEKSLPANVIQLAQGGGTVGALLVESDIDAVAFIGSTPTGKRIATACAPGLKRLVLEMGGKDPLLVFEDADVEAAADLAVDFSLMNTGQICTAYERIYVHRAIKQKFESLVLKKAQEASGLGPLVSKAGRQHVQEHVDEAVAKGAALHAGGVIPDGIGFFYPPTVLTEVPQKCSLMQEETFGPIVAIGAFNTEEEAIDLANDSVYGLGATICTTDMQRADRVGRQLEVATVAVNQWHAEEGPGCVAGGHKWSGLGLAFLGAEGLRQLTIPKSVLRKADQTQVAA
eukprot:CAMPEP_0172747856 /NCGR_PEP_ID=MMETSP1074-20121228/143763_1 /TAXON_ID=2916 /ORGANISM="Ceratium fusus, Strain PA161109" /LENGTH=456 /DNA_ID=CAMNT_0013579485 /DNA_START=39 /DNA_END=1409 /DNA_ORIENTATION=-